MRAEVAQALRELQQDAFGHRFTSARLSQIVCSERVAGAVAFVTVASANDSIPPVVTWLRKTRGYARSNRRLVYAEISRTDTPTVRLVSCKARSSVAKHIRSRFASSK